jgi:hypothetical protein
MDSGGARLWRIGIWWWAVLRIEFFFSFYLFISFLIFVFFGF